MTTSRHQRTSRSLLRVLFKGLAAVPLLLSFVLVSSCVAIILPFRSPRLRLLARIASAYSRLGLRLLGLSIAGARGHGPRGQGLLVVANHLSWADILVLSSLAPSLFITSVELRSTFFLGSLARLGGCLFVERRSAGRLRGELAAISRLLADGFRVVLFPEGTTSNGDAVHPFKSALFASAIRSGARVLPVCLVYTRINGAPVTPENRDRICYYGGIGFFVHLFRVLGLRSITVQASFLETLTPEGGRSAKDLAQAAHRTIAASYIRARRQ